ncbi:unnamed protein product [Periconia digitata]|uniref:Uncharacterized protein n=1 Tax=Periconia digitata TaxID=1303443 RepID=A0A9W4UVM5_9PLEO|nr:unnamed protein product [Periconia digitata]
MTKYHLGLTIFLKSKGLLIFHTNPPKPSGGSSIFPDQIRAKFAGNLNDGRPVCPQCCGISLRQRPPCCLPGSYSIS